MEAEQQAELHKLLEDKYKPKIEAVFNTVHETAIERFLAIGSPNLSDMDERIIKDVIQDMWIGTIQLSSQSVIAEYKEGYNLETKSADFFQRIIDWYMKFYGGIKIANIVKATQEHLIKIIARARDDGDTLADMVKKLKEKLPVLSRYRAHVIARTETHSAGQFAMYETAKRSHVPLLKQWNSITDHRTRDFGEVDGVVDEYSHRIMNGTKIDIDDVFLVPDKYGNKEALKHPGDPNGSAGNIINCRCVLTFKRDKNGI